MTLGPEIRELSPQPAVTEVAVTDAAGIPAVVDSGFPRLFGRLAELGVELAGPPFIRYLRTGEELEMELGIPVGPAAGQPLCCPAAGPPCCGTSGRSRLSETRASALRAGLPSRARRRMARSGSPR